MPVYEYSATDMDESARSGTIAADSARQARDLLRERGLTVVAMQAARRGEARARGGVRRRDRAEVVAFIRELATLVGAGIPLLGALQTLMRQHSRRVRAVLQDLADQVAAGTSLSEAMARHAGHFDGLCVSIVRVGQETGALDVSLTKLAEFQEKTQRLQSRVVTALIYPAVVCLVGLVVSVFLMTYVVPNLLSTLSQAGKPLPAVTRVVKGASDLLLNGWWALLGGAVLAGVGVRLVLAGEGGRKAADRLLLRLPLVGTLIRKELTSRIAVILAALLRSGLPFVEAVRITRGTIGNRLFRQAMQDYEAAVTAGRDVAGPLEHSGVFSPMVVQMLAVGQKAGELEPMLEQLARAYDLEVATATQRLTAVLEPLLIVLLAVVVGFIAFATVLPILELSNVL